MSSDRQSDSEIVRSMDLELDLLIQAGENNRLVSRPVYMLWSASLLLGTSRHKPYQIETPGTSKALFSRQLPQLRYLDINSDRQDMNLSAEWKVSKLNKLEGK